MRVHLETNFSDFKYGLIEAKAKVHTATRMGMGLAVKQFMNDCLHMPPECPRKTGSLAASHSALVDGEAVATSESEPHSGGTGATPLLRISKVSPHLEGAVVAHKPYAAARHEGIAGRHVTLKPGSKWMEAKLISFGEVYFKMIASAVRMLK